MPNMSQQRSTGGGGGFGGRDKNPAPTPPAPAPPSAPSDLTQSQLDKMEADRQMLPCRFFASGFCKLGNRCRFYHPLARHVATAFRVPPLPPSFGVVEVLPSSVSTTERVIRNEMDSEAELRRSRLARHRPQEHSERTNSLLNAVLESAYAESELDSTGAGTGASGLVTYGSTQEPITTSAPTLFSHIDWEHFLAPGVRPPPIVNIPEKESKEKRKGLELVPDPADANATSTTGDEQSAADAPGFIDGDLAKKLSVKLELKEKLAVIAKELANEPVPVQPAVRPLDSFFKQFPQACLDMLPEAMLLRTGPPREPAKPTFAEVVKGLMNVDAEDGGRGDDQADGCSSGSKTHIPDSYGSGDMDMNKH